MQPIVTPPPPPEKTNREKLYDFSKSCLNKDIARTQNELGCAEAISYVLLKLKCPNFPAAGFLSTSDLYHWMQKNFMQVSEPLPGDIIISPTGTSTKGAAHGHVGVVGFYGIMSNNSMTGLYDQFYTNVSWYQYYHDKLGFPVLYFRWV